MTHGIVEEEMQGIYCTPWRTHVLGFS